MAPVYSQSEDIETVYTYDRWLVEYQKREAAKRKERLYYIKQCLLGVIMVLIGAVIPWIFEGDATVSLLVIPAGILLMLTKKKIILF